MVKPKKLRATAPAYRPDKKTKSVPAPTRRAAPVSPPTKAAKKEKKKTMTDQMQELEEQVEKLEEENAALRDKIASLEGASGAPPRKWVRGKLPGEKLIKTDSETGEFEEISQAEFDSLA